MLIVGRFKVAVSQCQEYVVAPKARKIFAILFQRNLLLRTSQQSLIEGAWAFSQPVAALTVTHPGA